MNSRLGLIGYGRMGHEVERLARDRGYELAAVFDSKNLPLRERVDGVVDVLIDFSHPTAVWPNMQRLEGTPVPVVIGSTGWHAHLDALTRMVDHHQMTVFHAANFSIGMNLFLRVARKAAALMNDFDDYDVWLHETHHCGKRDSPSGTAKVLGDILLEELDRKQQISIEPVQGLIPPGVLQMSSSRGDKVPGEHVVSFYYDADTLVLTHRARNRSGFALGALRAAAWVMGRKGMFTMDDMLGES